LLASLKLYLNSTARAELGAASPAALAITINTEREARFSIYFSSLFGVTMQAGYTPAFQLRDK
jgi:hypothetical protein